MTTSSPDTILREAHHQYRAGQLDQAMESFIHLADQNIRRAECLAYIGNIHFNKGVFDEAAGYWRQALEDDPTLVDAQINMGMMHAYKREWDKAHEHLRKAQETAPHRQDIIVSMGQVLLQEGKIREAQELITPLCQQADAEPNVSLLSAQLQAASGKPDLAEDTLSDLLKKRPDLPEAKINLAQLQMDQGRSGTAKTILSDVLATHSNHFHALAAYGKLLADTGEHRNALGYLQRAKQMQPADWSLDVYIGNAFRSMGQSEQAIAAFKRAASLNPRDPGIRQNLSRELARLVPSWHFSMLADSQRNELYEAAIAECVNEPSTVLDIGTGSGLLSLMAARHGAQKVYTCEESPHIYEAAQEIIRKNDHRSVVQVWNKRSTSLTSSDFSTAPDLLIAEIFDAGLLGEGAIKTFRHALSHLCHPDCQVIPAKAKLYGQLIDLPELSMVSPLRTICGFDLSPFDQFRVPGEYISQNVIKHKHHMLSAPQKILEIDFKNLFPQTPAHQCIRETLSFTATAGGSATALCFWFDLLLTDKITLSNHPGRQDNHWGQALYFLETPISLVTGQCCELTMCYNDHSIWFENLTLKTNES